MKKVWNSFLISFAMFSKIPVPRADWDKENMKYMMCFFPAIGVIIGLLEWGYGWVAMKLEFGSLMRAAGFVLIPLIVTGGIHLDGFLDTVDALSSYQPLEKKLQILKDSHAGAFAIIMGCAYFTLGLGVWSEMKTELLPVMAVTFALSRSLSALALSTFPKANKSGSLSMFSDAAQKKILLGTLTVWILACAAVALWLNPVIGGIMLLTQAAVFWYYHHVAMKEFGGTTGDIAGFFVQVCELACACTVMLGGKIV